VIIANPKDYGRFDMYRSSTEERVAKIGAMVANVVQYDVIVM